MVSIKKQKVKAYILLESLVALGLFVTITTLILTQLSHYQERTAKNLQKQEILNLAIMASNSARSFKLQRRQCYGC